MNAFVLFRNQERNGKFSIMIDTGYVNRLAHKLRVQGKKGIFPFWDNTILNFNTLLSQNGKHGNIPFFLEPFMWVYQGFKGKRVIFPFLLKMTTTYSATINWKPFWNIARSLRNNRTSWPKIEVPWRIIQVISFLRKHTKKP